jgi:hypothetical protein
LLYWLCGLLISVCCILVERLIATHRAVKMYERYFFAQGEKECERLDAVAQGCSQWVIGWHTSDITTGYPPKQI